jgi:hypothetical protein
MVVNGTSLPALIRRVETRRRRVIHACPKTLRWNRQGCRSTDCRCLNQHQATDAHEDRGNHGRSGLESVSNISEVAQIADEVSDRQDSRPNLGMDFATVDCRLTRSTCLMDRSQIGWRGLRGRGVRGRWGVTVVNSGP